MITFQIGQIVFSKSGRDKGFAFIIVELGVNSGKASETEYVYLCDGKRRTLDKPKKKKIKHLQPTSHVVSLAIPDGRSLQDADLRKYLKAFMPEGGNPHWQRTM